MGGVNSHSLIRLILKHLEVQFHAPIGEIVKRTEWIECNSGFLINSFYNLKAVRLTHKVLSTRIFNLLRNWNGCVTRISVSVATNCRKLLTFLISSFTDAYFVKRPKEILNCKTLYNSHNDNSSLINCNAAWVNAINPISDNRKYRDNILLSML